MASNEISHAFLVWLKFWDKNLTCICNSSVSLTLRVPDRLCSTSTYAVNTFGQPIQPAYQLSPSCMHPWNTRCSLWTARWLHRDMPPNTFLQLLSPQQSSCPLHDTCICTTPNTVKYDSVLHQKWNRKLTISIGFSSQWNLGKKMHSCPCSVMRVSSIDGWFLKSSCWLRCCAMQQFWLLIGKTGEHFTHSFLMLKPRSSSTHWSPFGLPSGSVIFWTLLHCASIGFESGIMVSCWRHCFLPSDLFISKAFKASAGRQACAEELSKMKSPGFLGWASSKMSTVLSNWEISCFVSHHGAPSAPG